MVAAESYEGQVDITGRVTMARIDEPRLALVTAGGQRVEAPFPPEREELVLTALRDHSRVQLRVQGWGRLAPDGQVESIESVQQLELAVPEPDSHVDHGALWEQIDALVASLPPEVVAQLPEDSAEQLDHYIYGTRKR